MQPSLSLILPAYNAERNLGDQVQRLLDAAEELTHQFEIVVVDDGSTDHTCNVADELAREYPQLRVIRHGQRRGLDAVVETALARTRGEVLMLVTPNEPVQLAELKRLWSASQNHATEALRVPPAVRPLSKALLGRLTHWGHQANDKAPQSVRLLHRQTASATASSSGIHRPASFLAHLRSLAVGE